MEDPVGPSHEGSPLRYGVVDSSFDPIQHISTKQNSLTKDISAETLDLPELDSLKILDEKAFPLFTQSCCERIKRELLLYHHATGNTLGPTLSECQFQLPFTFEALSHPRVGNILSSMAGFELEFCFDTFEVSQLATEATLDENYTNLSQWRKIPYTFICLIQLDENFNKRRFDGLSVGMAAILEGKLSSNLSALQLAGSGSAFKLNLMIVAKPANIIDFENQRVLLKIGGQSILKIAYYNDETEPVEDFQKCASWLDKHYDKLLSN